MRAGTAGASGTTSTAPESPRPGTSPARGRTGVTVLTGAAAVSYAAFSLLHFRRFRDGTFDLVIFDQAVRGYAHLHAPESVARGVANGIGPHFDLLGDHWSPILALLAPWYWIHDGPATLIVAQAVAFALAIPPLWVFARRLIGSAGAYFASAAYALSIPVAAALNFDFHEVAFVPVLTAIMAERFQAGRRAQATLAAAALLLVKEDMGLLVAGYGAYLALTRRRRLGAAFIVGGVAATWLATRVLVPAFGGSATFYWAYGELGNTAASAAWHAVTHPLPTLRILVSPGVKVTTVVSLLAPLGFLPLASPLSVAALPLLLERMLATGFPAWWAPGYHYDAFVVMVLVLAAVDGAARLQRLAHRRWPRPRLALPGGRSLTLATAWAGAACVAALGVLPWTPLGQLLHPRFYMVNARIRAAQAAVAMVPDGALVEAADYLGPRLSGRAHVLLLDGTPRWAPWVVADTRGLDFPFCSPADQAQLVASLTTQGYRQVFAREGYVVLHRPADGRTWTALRHPAPASRLRGNLCPRYQRGPP